MKGKLDSAPHKSRKKLSQPSIYCEKDKENYSYLEHLNSRKEETKKKLKTYCLSSGGSKPVKPFGKRSVSRVNNPGQAEQTDRRVKMYPVKLENFI